MTFLKVLAFSVVAVLVGIFLSSTMEPETSLGYPWQIEKRSDDTTKVFNINLGHTTLGEAETLLKEGATLTLFVPSEGNAVIEAYFNELFIGGLKAKMVLTFEVDPIDVNAMFERGIRISTLGSGTRKVTLDSNDETRMRSKVITSMTYLPSINLQAELIEKRFGQPENKITDTISGAEHWLYPDMGVDIVLHETEKEVIQYILPINFNRILTPLLESNPQ
ncbi:MAG: hypothetical protein OEY61_12385 [Gammaproteobacteria bacterium]|nr:hypothetical protein [Gammaproteobacteria bacterium]